MIGKAKASEVKKFLENEGIETKNISIRVNPTTWSIYVTLKDMTLPKNKIQYLLSSEYDRYERDIITGEILEGGNIFVFVEWDYDLYDNFINKYLEQAEEEMKNPFRTIRCTEAYDVNMSDKDITFYCKNGIYIRPKELNKYNLARVLAFTDIKNYDAITG